MTDLRKQANRMMFNKVEDEFMDGEAPAWCVVWAAAPELFLACVVRMLAPVEWKQGTVPTACPAPCHPTPLHRRGHHWAGRDWQGGQRPPARGGHAAAAKAERQGAEKGESGDRVWQ